MIGSDPAELPYPSGWFAVAADDELLADRPVRCRLAGADYVAFRDARGEPAVVSAHCPHLGAHMGYGGCVREGTLECPFHGFRFDRNGACVATGYGTKPPPAARLVSLPTHRSGGWLFAWYHPSGRPPSWTPPVLDAAGWSPLQRHLSVLRTHPQETTENSVDLGHFPFVHGYRDVQLRALEVDGPRLHTRYSFTRPSGFPGWARDIRVDIAVFVWGLGFSYVDANVEGLGLSLRHFVLPTALGDGQTALRLGVALRKSEGSRRGLGWLPRAVVDHLIAPATMRHYRADVMQDREIWENKRHIRRPLLADGDGPVGRYRKWCRQFYASGEGDGAEAGPPPEPAS